MREILASVGSNFSDKMRQLHCTKNMAGTAYSRRNGNGKFISALRRVNGMTQNRPFFDSGIDW